MRTMLQIKYTTTRATTYELQVRAMTSQIINGCNSAYDFYTSFNSEIKKLPKKTYAPPSSFYKAEIDETGTVCEVWHLNSQGDKDRKLGIVRLHDVSEEAYRKVRPVWLYD